MSAAIEVASVVLFFLAGRSMEAAGGKSGHALPWIAISILVTAPFVFLQPFATPSNSMANTLLMGDRVLVQVWPKPSPSFGDLLAFDYPLKRSETYLKRVIGVPGDRIRISNKIVYRNGAALRESYAIHESNYMDAYRDNFPSTPNFRPPPAAQSMLENVVDGELVVPEGELLRLGRQPRRLFGQPVLGICRGWRLHRQASRNLRLPRADRFGCSGYACGQS